jgi:glycine oxidase
MRVLIKGAGVAGLAAAHALVAQGATVAVHERGQRTGSGASWFAGGMLAPYCERESADARVLSPGLGAIDWWDRALPGLVHRCGTLVVAAPRDGGELARFAARTCGSRWLDEDAIADLEPALAGRFRQARSAPGHRRP